jgi:pSer/pThr/pTyr-binding forkhead associated (FHA) protein
VRIDDSTISRRHARLVIADKRASIEDLGSKNGTLLRGRRVNKPVRLSDGDVIAFGSVNLIFRAVLPGTTTATAREPNPKRSKGRDPSLRSG